jgi:hypothetical protein
MEFLKGVNFFNSRQAFAKYNSLSRHTEKCTCVQSLIHIYGCSTCKRTLRNSHIMIPNSEEFLHRQCNSWRKVVPSSLYEFQLISGTRWWLKRLTDNLSQRGKCKKLTFKRLIKKSDTAELSIQRKQMHKNTDRWNNKTWLNKITLCTCTLRHSVTCLKAAKQTPWP